MWKAEWSKEPSPEEHFKVLDFIAKVPFDLFGNLGQENSVLAHTLKCNFPGPEDLQVHSSVQEPRHSEALQQLRVNASTC